MLRNGNNSKFNQLTAVIIKSRAEESPGDTGRPLALFLGQISILPYSLLRLRVKLPRGFLEVNKHKNWQTDTQYRKLYTQKFMVSRAFIIEDFNFLGKGEESIFI